MEPQPAYSERLIQALEVAAQLHAAQRRKGTDIPYLAHLIGTCAIALEYGADEDEAIAALLHDAIEDVTPTETARATVGTFGEHVLHIVEACTDTDWHPKPPWHPRKEAYLRSLAGADASVLLVSASDKLHNARSVVADLRTVGDKVWDRFTASRSESLWYYRALVEAFRANPAHPGPLVDNWTGPSPRWNDWRRPRDERDTGRIMEILRMVDTGGDDPLIGAGCTLDAAEMPGRLRQWADLRDRSTGVRAITGGVAISLASTEAMGQVAELAARESECCPFYTFQIRIDGPTRELEITAGAGREIAVQALLGIG